MKHTTESIMKTFISGKDAALEDSINYFQQQLRTFGLEVEEISWLNPVPNVWSVHIQNKQCPLCFSNGKGASQKAALASALGEYFERLSTHYYFSDFYLGESIANAEFVHHPAEKWFSIPNNNALPKGLLSKPLLQFYDPNNELVASDLIDLPSSNQNRGICALPFIQYSTQKTVYVPINLIANLYASNGMSAGNTQNEARVQALSEIFERYVKNKIIAEAISLPAIPVNVLDRYPQAVEAIETLEQQGFPIFCFDASLGGEFPVICVVLLNPQNSTCYASFGSHPNFGVALERTITELLQGRNLKDLDCFSPPSFDNESIADLNNLETHFIDSSGIISWDLFNQQNDYMFVDWDFSGTTEQEFCNLMEIMQSHQTEVLMMDYQQFGVYTCRIIAVGMSEIYPPEDLLIANNNMAIHWRDTLLSLPESKLEAEQYLTMIEQLDDDNLDDFAKVRELLGLATGKNNSWNTLRIGELKSMLALAGQDLEQAKLWIDWTIDVNHANFTQEKNLDYRCLQTLVDFRLNRPQENLANYQRVFEKMFGKTTVNKMWQYAIGEKTFFELFKISPDLHELPTHQQLITIYQKSLTQLATLK